MSADNGQDSKWYEAFQVLERDSKETKENVKDIKLEVYHLSDIKTSMNHMTATLQEIKNLMRTNSNRAFYFAVIVTIGVFLVVFLAMGFKDIDKILSIVIR
jgi:t-SNARE complex subunit (syntaxin)